MDTLGVRRKFDRRWIWQAAISTLSAVVIFLVAWRFAWLTHLEDRLYDVGLNLSPEASGSTECVVIGIDSATIADWPDPKFPILRHLPSHTQLVRILDSVGAKVICFDILFDRIGPYPTSEIVAFADACRSAGSVLLASTLEQSHFDDMVPMSVDRILMPHPILLSSIAGTGMVDVPLDADNRIRRMDMGIRFRDTILSTIAVQASRLHSNAEPAEILHDRSFLIDYSWIQRISIISYRDAIESKKAVDIVRGKIVFVGVTLNEGGDNYITPINDEDSKKVLTPGVIIHAVATQTLLGDKDLTTISIWQSVLILMVMAGTISLLVYRTRSWIAVVVFVGCAAMLIIGSPLLVVCLGVVAPVGKWLIGLAGCLAVHWAIGITWLRDEAVTQQGVIHEFHAEMKSAQVIQQHLQPRVVPSIAGLDIAVIQLTCQEIGGDYYDFVDFGDESVGLLIGDVAGKGLPASLIMSNVQAIFREQAKRNVPPSEVMRIINQRLNEISTASGRFMSLFYGVLDSSKGLLTYSNAGHCRPIICSSDGVSRELTEGGLFLGPFDQSEWCDYECRILSGDRICLYTDGVSEAYDLDILNQFGEERIAKCLQVSEGTSVQILNHLLHDCKDYTRSTYFKDDWTAIILQYNPVRSLPEDAKAPS